MDDRQQSRSTRRPIDDYPTGPQDMHSEKSSRQSSFSINKSSRTFPNPDETIIIAENMDENTSVSIYSFVKKMPQFLLKGQIMIDYSVLQYINSIQTSYIIKIQQGIALGQGGQIKV